MKAYRVNNKFLVFLMLVPAVLCSCTEPGDTTYAGAATGGVLGAGLGAIVGNQTGDPGSGLVIGGVAGAGAGAAIGNALESQQKAIRTQDEAIERQQKLLAAQNSEIQELKGSPGDLNQAATGRTTSRSRSTNDMRGSLNRDISLTDQLNNGADIEISDASSATEKPLNKTAKINNQAAVNSNSTLAEKDLAKSATTTEKQQTASLATQPQSGECAKAQAEANKAETATEGADKLFYLRRAIRLCPSNALYHKNLANQYLALGRNEDAKSAYQDALRLDPDSAEVKEALKAVSSGNVY